MIQTKRWFRGIRTLPRKHTTDQILLLVLVLYILLQVCAKLGPWGIVVWSSFVAFLPWLFGWVDEVEENQKKSSKP